MQHREVQEYRAHRAGSDAGRDAPAVLDGDAMEGSVSAKETSLGPCSGSESASDGSSLKRS